MTPQQIEQVFGRGRLKMATGEHVEVFREAMMPGERRRYTKRFLKTSAGDFGPWTEREWRILARLIGHGIRCVPDVVQFDGGAPGGTRLVQTYDAGITVDQWGTLLPVVRRRQQYPHVFEDCAHWWSLAHHCLAALDEIHALGLVHLDIKGDNICIPYGPFDFDPEAAGARFHPQFERLALIDFAFSLVSRESLAMALPIGWQKDYDYQSPRLLRALDAGRNGDLEPTKELDWRCDLYSLAAMLKRYLPATGRAHVDNAETGWSSQRYDEAKTLILRLRDSHDGELSHRRPHAQFIDYTSARLHSSDLAASLADGWALSRDTVAVGTTTPMTPITPMTRIAPAIRASRGYGTALRAAPSTIADAMTLASLPSGIEPSRPIRVPNLAPTAITEVVAVRRTRVRRAEPQPALPRAPRRMSQRALPISIGLATLVAIAAPSFVGDPEHPLGLRPHELGEALTSRPQGRTFVVQEAETVAQRTPVATDPVQVARATDSTGPAIESASSAAVGNPVAAPGEPSRAVPQFRTEEAGVAKPVETASASPERIEPAATSDATIADGIATSPISNEPGAALSPPPQTKRPAMPPSRVQTTKRSSKVAVKPTEKPIKAYADAARRTPSNPVAGLARAGGPTPRPHLATVTAASSVPASSALTPPAAAGSGSERVRSGTDMPVSIGATIETNRNATVDVDPDAAKPATTPVGADPAPGEPAVARAEATPRRGVNHAKPRDDWRMQLANLFSVLRDRAGPAAPVEDRIARTSNDGRVAVPRSLAQPTTDVRPRAGDAAGVTGAAIATSPRSVSTALSTVTDGPVLTDRRTAASPPLTTMFPKHDDAGKQAQSVAEAGSATVAMPPSSEIRPLAVVEPPATPRRVAAPPRAWPDEAQDLAAEARRLLADTVPRIASLAEPDVSRVLAAAAVAVRPSQARLIIDAADGPWSGENAWIPVREATSAYARRLHDRARRTLAAGGTVTDAINIESQAFGADPRDPDIAGYLGYLYLRTTPARPEIARQLALHSIVFSRSRRSTRQFEWNVFAVASALMGRELDAVRAFLIEATLTGNVDRSCQSVFSAYATYGERLRVPAMAFLQRVNEHGRAYGASSCMRSVNF